MWLFNINLLSSVSLSWLEHSCRHSLGLACPTESVSTTPKALERLSSSAESAWLAEPTTHLVLRCGLCLTTKSTESHLLLLLWHLLLWHLVRGLREYASLRRSIAKAQRLDLPRSLVCKTHRLDLTGGLGSSVCEFENTSCSAAWSTCWCECHWFSCLSLPSWGPKRGSKRLWCLAGCHLGWYVNLTEDWWTLVLLSSTKGWGVHWLHRWSLSEKPRFLSA